MLAAIEARGGKSAFLNFLEGPRRPAVARRDPRRHRHDDRLGAVDAQAHHPADRRDAALVPAPLRRDGRRDDPRRAPPARVAARHPARRALRPLDDGRSVLPRHDRQEADAGGGAAAADPRRPADLERPRRRSRRRARRARSRRTGRRRRAGCRSTRRWSAS